MKQFSLLWCVFVCVLLIAAASAKAQPRMSYQGLLTDDLGQPITGMVSLEFDILDDAEGVVLWHETRNVYVDNGRVSLYLGDDSPIPDSAAAPTDGGVSESRWLRVTVNDEVMAPTLLGASSMAFASRRVQGDIKTEPGLMQVVNANPGYPTSVNVVADLIGTRIIFDSAGTEIVELDDNGLSFYRKACVEPSKRSLISKTRYSACGLVYEDSTADTLMSTDEDGTVVYQQTKSKAVPLAGLTRTGIFWTPGAADGYVFTSDANGVGSWQPLSGGGDDGDWCLSSGILKTCDDYGLNRSGSTILGTNASTHVNLGRVSDIGSEGSGIENSVIGGGYHNDITGSFAVVSGGFYCSASEAYAVVGGGRVNHATGGASTVGGGWFNRALADYATVAGGVEDTALGIASTVGGGWGNVAAEDYCTIAGGIDNRSSGYASAVGGGNNNRATDLYTVIAGGTDNYVRGAYSGILGGLNNSLAGQYSTILGGARDTLGLSATYSMAFGEDVYVNTAYRAVFFNDTLPGYLGINRDDHAGGILHPIHVGTFPGTGAGAYLSSGGTWTNGSSRNFKENFQALDGARVLDAVAAMSIEAWTYRNTNERHIGPVAEDFVGAFNVGAVVDGELDTEHLAPSDVAGVALVCVQELKKENDELRQMVEELKQQVETLTASQGSRR